MSSRLPTSVVEAVALLVDGPEELERGLLAPVDVALQQAGDRRLDRRQRGAEVVGHGSEQRHAQLVGPGEQQRLGGLLLHRQPLPGRRLLQRLDLGARPERLLGARRSPASTRRLTSSADDEEHHERQRVLPVGDREPVERRREVVVRGQRADDGGHRGRADAADRARDHHEQQVEEQVAREAERARAGWPATT